MSFVDFIILILFFVQILLAFFSFRGGQKKWINFFFGLFVLFLSGWGISIIVVKLTQFILMAKLAFAFGVLSICFLFCFSLFFPDRKRANPVFLVPAFLIAALLFFASFFDGLIFEGVEVINGAIVTERGPLYPLFLIYALLFVLISFVIQIFRFFKSSGEERLKLKFFLAGLTLFSILAILANVVLPAVGVRDFNTLGPAFSIIFVISAFYAIVRYRFMDIRIFLRRWMVDLVAVVFVTLFGLLAVLVSPWGFPSMAEVVFRIAILIFAVLAYRHIHAFFLNIANKFFFTTLYDFEVRTKTFVRNLPAMIDLEMIVASTTRFLSTVMGVDNVAILLANRKASSTFEIHSNTGFDEKSLRKLLKRTMLKKKVAQDPEIFVLNEAQFLIDSEKTSERKKSILKEVIRALEMVDAYVLVPIIINDQLIGMIFLSEKITKDAYTKEDIELLLNIARQSSVPIDNAFLYQEVQDFSENLQDKVDEQTKEIRDLYEVKSNFLTVASHQLRTPTSIIRGMLSILTEEDLPQEKQKEMIDAAYKSSSTLERVINDILIAAEIDSDKFEVRPEKVDIIPIISSVVDDLSLKAEKTHVRLEMKNPRWKKALVLADDTKIDQVFYNLIDNAISYSPKGDVVVSLGKEKKRGSEYFVFTCKDDGVGMSKEDMKNIGEKFYRSDNVFSIRPNGTGLGVFIVNQIVKASKGELSFDSKGIGKGSVFKVYLKAVSTRKKKAK